MISHANRTTMSRAYGVRWYKSYNMINIFPNFAVKVTNRIENYCSKDGQKYQSGKLGSDGPESVSPDEQKDTVYR